VQSRGRFQEISKYIAWLNNTLRRQSELNLHIRQLEYSMLAVQQIGELFSSVQYAILGMLPVSLVTPVTLLSILTNISLNLPDNYELVARTKFQDIQIYCELVKIAYVGNAHGVQLVMCPLEDSCTTLHTIFRFPFFLRGGILTPL